MEVLHRKEDVLKIVNKKEGSWRLLVKQKVAPQPIYVGPKSPRWRESDIVEYLRDPMAYAQKLQKIEIENATNAN